MSIRPPEANPLWKWWIAKQLRSLWRSSNRIIGLWYFCARRRRSERAAGSLLSRTGGAWMVAVLASNPLGGYESCDLHDGNLRLFFWPQ